MKRRRFLPALGLILLALFAAAALFPSLFTPYGLKEAFAPWLAPSRAHPLGTNSLGCDILAELVYGAGDTLLVGLASSVLSLALGAVIGALSARRGLCGGFFSALTNVFALLPRLIALVVLSAFFGSGARSLIVLISVFGWAASARAVRAGTRHLQSLDFIDACAVQGFGRGHILFFHLIPNLRTILLSRFLAGVSSCVMTESTLSFLGFGDLYRPTWGTMISLAYRRGAFLRGAWNYLLPPGICIILLTMSFYFISLYFESRGEAAGE